VKGFVFWLFLSLLLLAVGISWSYIIGLTPNTINQISSRESSVKPDYQEKEIQEIVPLRNEKSVTDFFSYIKGKFYINSCIMNLILISNIISRRS